MNCLRFFFLASACFWVTASVGCTPAGAVARCDKYEAINREHAADEQLPPEARMVAQDNADAWEAQGYLLRGEKPPGPQCPYEGW